MPKVYHRLLQYSLLLLLTTGSTSVWAGEILLRLSNPPERGHVIALVFQDADNFGSFRDAWRREVFSAREPEQPYRIQDLPEGDYAVLLFWDENDNGRLDRNFIGIPSESIALTNDYQPQGPPSFQRARVRVTAGESVEQTLSLNRPLGSFGQVGLGIGVIGQTSPYRDSTDRPLQAIPAITYLGNRLQWTGPQIRYLIADGDNWQLVGNFGIEALDSAIVNSPIVDRQRLGRGFLTLSYTL